MKILAIVALLLAANALSAQDQRTYHPDGSVKENRWVTADRVEFVKYHPNGRMEERGAFAQGKPDGIWKRFDENGKLMARVHFVNGLREGRCFYTNFDGQTRYRLQYAQGQLVHGAQLNPGGEVIAERGGE